MIKKFFESTYNNTTISISEFDGLLVSGECVDITNKDIQQIQKYFDKFVVKTKVTPKYLVRYSKESNHYQAKNILPKADKVVRTGVYNVDDWNKYTHSHFPKNIPKTKLVGFGVIYLYKGEDDWFYFNKSTNNGFICYKCDSIDGLFLELDRVLTKNWKLKDGGDRNSIKSIIDEMSEADIMKLNDWLESQGIIKKPTQ